MIQIIYWTLGEFGLYYILQFEYEGYPVRQMWSTKFPTPVQGFPLISQELT